MPTPVGVAIIPRRGIVGGDHSAMLHVVDGEYLTRDGIDIAPVPAIRRALESDRD